MRATRRQLLLAQAGGDAALLGAAIAMEQEAAFAYAALADGGRLGPLGDVARQFAEQEQEHADALSRALRNRGGSPPSKPSAAGDVPGLARALRGARGQALEFAVELENRALAAYYRAHARLEAPELLSTVASIMGSEAQHLVVLRQALGTTPVTEAFVTGSLRPGEPRSVS